MNKLNQKEYSKAYYKRKVRNKIRFTTEILTLQTRRFIFNKNPGWYLGLFNASEEPLLNSKLPEHLGRYRVGVLRRGTQIEFVFSIKTPTLNAGYISLGDLDSKQRSALRNYGIIS